VSEKALSVVVVGASGDLARKKVFPALFALYCQGFLPPKFRVFGFARSAFSHEEFRARIMANLTCRYVPGESCAERMDEFLAKCFYVAGQYGSSDSFLDLYQLMQDVEVGGESNRIFYMAIPPSIFLDVARAIGDAGLVSCTENRPWSRVVIEKPFGRDRESSDVLTREMAQVFSEEQTFRIDHYLGKEVIQNLMILRFANIVFEPIWNRSCIEQVTITWKEDIGVGARGGYYDDYGIVRDVIQNHMLQILALAAIERPRSADAKHVRDEKVRVLRSMAPVRIEDLVLGQYGAGEINGKPQPGYTDDASVPDDSRTPTYASCRLRVDNDRWQGVPFVITAGKAMDEKLNEIRVRFRPTPANIFRDTGDRLPANELVIRIQPDEAIFLNIVNKEPGLAMSLADSSLNLRYEAAFSGEIPDAYERLLLDVIQGDKSLFIRDDELAAAWDIFTPALHEIEEKGIRPEAYVFGSQGPKGGRVRSFGGIERMEKDQEGEQPMNDSQVCEGDHGGHLCLLMSEGKVEDVKKLVTDPQYICFNCGRVADSETNLCNPMPLTDEMN